MPNPYHDAAGRFASRDEMAAEVDRLEASGDRAAWMEMRVALAEADAASAKSELTFHKAVTEFATDADAGYVDSPQNSIFGGGRPKYGRNYTRVISAASNSAQLSEAWAVAQQGGAVNAVNIAAVLNHPDVTPELEDFVLAQVRWTSDGGVELARRLNNVTPERAHALAFNSDVRALDVRREVFKALSETDRHALMTKDPNYVADYVSQLGWNDSLAPHAQSFISLSSRSPNRERYGHYGSIPAMESTQLYVEAAQLVHADTDEAFDRLLALGKNEFSTTGDEGPLMAAAESSTIDSARADMLAKRLTLKNFEALSEAVRENPRADAEVAARFVAEPQPYLLPGKPDAGLKAEVAAAKQNMQGSKGIGGSYYVNEYAQRYYEVQARYDSHPSTFAALQARAARYRQDYVDGKVGTVANRRMEERLHNAEQYQRLLGLKASLHDTADQLVRADAVAA